MEYKRYINFLNDENSYEFHTYLPIQLDATCNGFQHLALLSNEDTLFKELNLIVDGSNTPNDFYNFLVHKLDIVFDKKIEEGSRNSEYQSSSSPCSLSEDKYNSYVRLKTFVLDRSVIKKAIMTIPYNASQLNMRKYITYSLHLAEKYNSIGSDNIS
jgi:DNA-directed RNA polymerase